MKWGCVVTHPHFSHNVKEDKKINLYQLGIVLASEILSLSVK